MKIFKKQNRGPVLSKSDIFTGKIHEHFEPIEGYEHASQSYVRGIIEGTNTPLQLTKYHLIKKFKQKSQLNKDISTQNNQKTTKYIRQMSKIYYFTVLTKKMFYLTSTLKRIKKTIKIWIKQLIQNEIYYLKKALSIAKNKEQIAKIYVKFKKHMKLYKKIHLKYLKATYIQYLKLLKKHKRYWNRMFITGFTKKKYYKKRARILPFIMFLKRRFFKKLRNGTHRNIQYWRKLIRKFAKKYSILQEQDISALVSDRYPNTSISIDKRFLNSSINISVKPYILLKYMLNLRTKSRTEMFNKLRKMYYTIMLNNKLEKEKNINIKYTLAQLRLRKNKLKWKKVKAQKLNKLSRLSATALKKKAYILQKGYLKRSGASNMSRLIEKNIAAHTTQQHKSDILTKVMLTGKLSMWFVLFKNWNRMSYVKLLKQVIKKSYITRFYKNTFYKKKYKNTFNKKKINGKKKITKLFSTKLKKNNKLYILLQLRSKIRNIIRRLNNTVPSKIQQSILKNLLKKLVKNKSKFKKKNIKRKLIRMLRRKKKGIIRTKKNRTIKNKIKRSQNKRFKRTQGRYKYKNRYQKKRRKKNKKKVRNKKHPGMRRVVKKSKRLKRTLKWKLKKRIKKCIRRGGKKYKHTAFLIQDYSGHWIDNLRKKTKFKKKKGKRSILNVSEKVRKWKMRRLLKKNYRETLNSRLYITIRQKEIAALTANTFTPAYV